MKPAALLAAAAFVLLGSLPASAQVRIEMRDGRVSLDAQNVPVRQILAEWARVGGATIVNAEKVGGAPVTLQLTDVPERQALDVILRNVSGYMLAMRQAGSVGASAFDRILILPTSSAPRAAAAPPPAAPAYPQPQPYPQPGMPRQGGAVQPLAPVDADDPDEEPEGDVAPEEAEPEEEQQGNPNRPAMFPGPGVRPGMPPQPPEASEAPPEVQEPAAVPSPGNPFGLPPGSTAQPGVVTPVPQQPRPGTRPPL